MPTKIYVEIPLGGDRLSSDEAVEFSTFLDVLLMKRASTLTLRGLGDVTVYTSARDLQSDLADAPPGARAYGDPRGDAATIAADVIRTGRSDHWPGEPRDELVAILRDHGIVMVDEQAWGRSDGPRLVVVWHHADRGALPHSYTRAEVDEVCTGLAEFADMHAPPVRADHCAEGDACGDCARCSWEDSHDGEIHRQIEEIRAGFTDPSMRRGPYRFEDGTNVAEALWE